MNTLVTYGYEDNTSAIPVLLLCTLKQNYNFSHLPSTRTYLPGGRQEMGVKGVHLSITSQAALQLQNTLAFL